MDKKLIILAAINLISIVGGGGLAFYSLAQKAEVEAPVVVSETTHQTLQEYLKAQKIFADKPIIYSLPPVTVNLANEEEEKIIQVEVNIEMLDEQSYSEVFSKSAAVKDVIVQLLAKKYYQDISSVQGKLFLKDDMAVAINQQLDNGFVKDIYFTRFMLQ